MVPTPEHNQTKPRERRKASQANDIRPRNGLKPLNQFKFYLDIKNHNLAFKIESKIKELGGTVDLFLVKEVTHVITDSIADIYINNASSLASTSLSSSYYSPVGPSSIKSIDSPKSPGACKSSLRLRHKSRADAMLERARSHRSPAEINRDNSPHQPVDLARAWNIPVWNVEKVLKYLTKISDSARTNFSVELNESRKLVGAHIKVETVERDFRPSYKYLQNWPVLSISGDFSSCPFKVPNKRKADLQKSLVCDKISQGQLNDSILTEKICNNINIVRKLKNQVLECEDQAHRTVAHFVELNKMTRKTRQRTRRKEIANSQCGYCEICHVDYPDLTSHAHSGEHLSYVRNDSNFLTLDTLISAGANVEAFLKLNESTNSSSVSKCNGFSKRSLRSIKTQETRNVKNQLIGSNFNESSFNITHAKGSRKSSDQSIIMNGNEMNNAMERHRLRSRAQLNLPNNLLGTTAEDICKSPKASSPRDVKPIKVANYIKSEDDIPIDTLRATKIKGIRWKCPSPETCHVIPASPSYKIVDSKFKTKEPEAKCSEKSTGLVVKFKRIRQSELMVLSDEAENFMFPKRDDSSDCDSDYRESSSNIKENSDMSDMDADYTIPSSKLASTDEIPMRCTRQRLQNTSAMDDEEDVQLSDLQNDQRFQIIPTQPHNETSVGDRVGIENETNLTSEDINKFVFSFECVPNELWYHTYKRQDENKEFIFDKLLESNSIKRYKLPYELGPLAPLKPNCCKLNVVTSGIEDDSNYSTSERKVKRRRRIFLTNGKSRKSPREHASTLASLVQQRKKGEKLYGVSSDLTSVIEEDFSRNSTPLHNSDSSEMLEDSVSLVRRIDSLLSDLYDDKTCFDIGDILEDGISLNIRYEPTINNLLETLDDSTVLEDPKFKVLFGITSTKQDGRLRKKRKNNRTGWPKKKKNLPRPCPRYMEKSEQSCTGIFEDSFVNAATQTSSSCEITNNEVVLSIPVTDNSVNIVELSGEPIVVCTEHIDSCSSTTDSGKENQCHNDKTITFDNSDTFTKCVNKSNASITNSDNFENLNKNKTADGLENMCMITSSSDDGHHSSNLDWEENSNNVQVAAHLGNIYKDDDSVSEDRKFQPFVCVQKIDEPHNPRRLRSSKSPQRSHSKKKRMKNQTTSVCTLSPRKLRAPRGRWYRER